MFKVRNARAVQKNSGRGINMENLKLPIIREKFHKGKWLSMDGYLKFIVYNLKYTVNMNSARESKKNLFVGMRFVLK